MNHPNFPYGKGLWIWNLKNCFNGDINKIISKCKEVGVNYLIICAGNKSVIWEEQFNPELIKILHANNIKIYSWARVYGDNPLEEAAIATWALDLGADGHVFDPEIEYEGKNQSAKTMLWTVRYHFPDAFLAYSPFPMIDSHPNYPYVEFSKFCDAVMPQMFFGDFKVRPEVIIIETSKQFTNWKNKATTYDYKESIKPIIPLGQAYDNPKTEYISTAEDIAEFIQNAKEYKSVNFWSFEHILRDDIWAAIKNNNVNDNKQVIPEKYSMNGKIDSPRISTETKEVTKPHIPSGVFIEKTIDDSGNELIIENPFAHFCKFLIFDINFYIQP